jgi:hypothetical protein
VRLPLVLAGADDEVVGDEGELAQIQDDDVFGFLVVADAGARDGQLAGGGGDGSIPP